MLVEGGNRFGCFAERDLRYMRELNQTLFVNKSLRLWMYEGCLSDIEKEVSRDFILSTSRRQPNSRRISFLNERSIALWSLLSRSVRLLPSSRSLANSARCFSNSSRYFCNAAASFRMVSSCLTIVWRRASSSSSLSFADFRLYSFWELINPTVITNFVVTSASFLDLARPRMTVS